MFVCVCVCVCVCVRVCVCVCVRVGVGVRVGVTPTSSPYRMSPASLTVNLNVKISVSDSWHLVEVAAFSPPSLSPSIPLFLLLSPSLPLPLLPSLSVIPKPDEADNTTIIVVAVVLGIVALSLVGIFIVIALSLIK